MEGELKEKPERSFSEERMKVYNTSLAIVRARPRSKKKDRIALAEITKASGLEKSVVANALKWLNRKDLAYTKDGKDGWFVNYVQPRRMANFCWKHGIFKVVEGRGKNRKVLCPICERSKKRRRL